MFVSWLLVAVAFLLMCIVCFFVVVRCSVVDVCC